MSGLVALKKNFLKNYKLNQSNSLFSKFSANLPEILLSDFQKHTPVLLNISEYETTYVYP